MTNSFNKLYEVIKTLIAPDGCPWDSVQTPESMKRYLVEETFEALEGRHGYQHIPARYFLHLLLLRVRLQQLLLRGAFRLLRQNLPLVHVNAGEKFPDFAGLKFPLSGKKIY